MKTFLKSALLVATTFNFAYGADVPFMPKGAPGIYEITEGIKHPESAIYSEMHGVFFVSNVASGNPLETKEVGYLSKISVDGKTVQAKWVKG
ncbi:MAG TPA: hypothetical protein VNJ01_00010 [Bacteriovoracaceae bacterium]|nr:hypothetical protein [Bacteriovoracaceae bacterium]